MFEEKKHIWQHRLIGGELCLDFVNTVDWRFGDPPGEYLTHYSDLIAWGLHVGILDEAQATRLLEQSQSDRQAARQTFEDVIGLREAIFQLFLATVRQQQPDAANLESLNDAIKAISSQSYVIPEASGYRWQLPDQLDCMLWPIIWSAATLLTSDKLDRVKLCDGEDCGWLFLDTSRNRSRRWCSMETCGNRAKAKRHYARNK